MINRSPGDCHNSCIGKCALNKVSQINTSTYRAAWSEICNWNGVLKVDI